MTAIWTIFPPGAPLRRGGVPFTIFSTRPFWGIPPPPRPLTLASSLRMGPLAGGGLLRKSLHDECFNYHVTTRPTTETARHAFLTARTTLNLKANTTRITRHGHTRRTSTGTTRSALDHCRACKQPASCSDGSRSGCSGLTSGARAAKSLGMTRHLPGRRGGGSTQSWRSAGAGRVCGTAAHRREALSARKS